MQVILFAFASYFIADGQKQSGIVSVLFCGMVCPSTFSLIVIVSVRLWHELWLL